MMVERKGGGGGEGRGEREGGEGDREKWVGNSTYTSMYTSTCMYIIQS